MPSKPKRKGHATRTSFRAGGPNPHAFKKRDPDAVPEAPSGTEITPLQLIGLTKLAAQGVRAHDMRFAVNMSSDVWQSYCAEHPEVHDAISKGEAQMHDRIAAVLVRKALRGDFMSAALLMNSRFNYRNSEDDSPRVTIVIPGAQPSSKVIEGARLSELTPEELEGCAQPTTVAALIERANPDGESFHDLTPAYATEPTPPQREPTAQERQALRDFEFEVGINSIDLKRSDFDSDAAYARWCATPPKKQ